MHCLSCQTVQQRLTLPVLEKDRNSKGSKDTRVYGQFCIETLHESRNLNSTFGGLFVRVCFAKRVQIYRIGKAPFAKVRFCPHLARCSGVCRYA